MTDFLVIGGGIAGLSAGAHLSDLGAVTVLEREDALAFHASGRSAALFAESYGAPSTVALNRASRPDHDAAEVLTPRGLMVVGTPETAVAFDIDVTQMELEPISVAEALGRMPVLDPGTVDRAAFNRRAWDIDTDRLVQGYARRIRHAGGDVCTGVAVTAIARTATGWQVTTDAGVRDARILVNAAGAWADAIAGLAGVGPLGLHPLRRSIARLKAPGGHNVSDWPMVIGAGESWYAKPDAGALIVSPADADPAEPHDAWADDMVLAEGLARYQAHVIEEVTRPLATWAGLRTFTPDRQLAIGPAPQDPAFLWCAGQGGYGFQSAPAAARLLADLAAGRPPEIGAEIAAAVSPARFG